MPLYRVFRRNPFYETVPKPGYLFENVHLELVAPDAEDALLLAKSAGVQCPSVEPIAEDQA